MRTSSTSISAPSEPQGGIIANLLNLPGEPPVELNVSGSGPAADWSGSGTFAVDGVVVTRVEGRHQLTDMGNAIEAKGDGEFDRFVPEMLRPLLSGKTVFDFAGTALTDGGVDVDRATIESNALTGSATGVVDPAGLSDFALDFRAKGEGVPLAFGTAESPIDMVVQIGHRAGARRRQRAQARHRRRSGEVVDQHGRHQRPEPRPPLRRLQHSAAARVR